MKLVRKRERKKGGKNNINTTSVQLRGTSQ
jgi:hypothetical protein